MKYQSKVASRCFTKGFLNCQPHFYKAVYVRATRNGRKNRAYGSDWKKGGQGYWQYNYMHRK